MNTDNSIIRNLIKVKLTVCAWTGKIRSDELAAELEAKHSADKGTLAVQILQIPENKTRDITTTMSQMRAMWNNNTLPWEDKGWRVVPVKHYQTLMDDTRRMKQTFEEYVAKLISGSKGSLAA